MSVLVSFRENPVQRNAALRELVTRTSTAASWLHCAGTVRFGAENSVHSVRRLIPEVVADPNNSEIQHRRCLPKAIIEPLPRLVAGRNLISSIEAPNIRKDLKSRS